MMHWFQSKTFWCFLVNFWLHKNLNDLIERNQNLNFEILSGVCILTVFELDTNSNWTVFFPAYRLILKTLNDEIFQAQLKN